MSEEGNAALQKYRIRVMQDWDTIALSKIHTQVVELLGETDFTMDVGDDFVGYSYKLERKGYSHHYMAFGVKHGDNPSFYLVLGAYNLKNDFDSIKGVLSKIQKKYKFELSEKKTEWIIRHEHPIKDKKKLEDHLFNFDPMNELKDASIFTMDDVRKAWYNGYIAGCLMFGLEEGEEAWETFKNQFSAPHHTNKNELDQYLSFLQDCFQPFLKTCFLGVNAEIGGKIWMSKNLDVVTFRNGDLIPRADDGNQMREFSRAKQPAWCYLNQNVKNKEFGKLYNWYAVNDPRGILPEGWRLPTLNEWRAIYEKIFDGRQAAAKQLKSTIGWTDNGNNGTLFSGLPYIGHRKNGDGMWENVEYWLSDEVNENSAWYGGLQQRKKAGMSLKEFYEDKASKGEALAIRGIKK